MDRERSERTLLVAVVTAFAGLIGLFVGGMMLASYWMMGAMMGVGPTAVAGTWGGFALVVAGTLGIAFALFSIRPSRATVTPIAYAPIPIPRPDGLTSAPAASAVPQSVDDAARAERLLEVAIAKSLGEDELRLYLQVRDADGQTLQREIVASGTFSKAKVTRLLDRLERKGLVVRERHGTTNRIRLTRRPPHQA